MNNSLCKAIHLPADLNSSKKSGIYINLNGLLINESIPTCEMQHLYFVSSETIKIGDWFISELNEIWKCGSIIPSKISKKVIATTDRKLGLPIIKKHIVYLYTRLKGNIGEMSIGFALKFTYVLKEHKRGEKLYKRSDIDKLLTHLENVLCQEYYSDISSGARVIILDKFANENL